MNKLKEEIDNFKNIMIFCDKSYQTRISILLKEKYNCQILKLKETLIFSTITQKILLELYNDIYILNHIHRFFLYDQQKILLTLDEVINYFINFLIEEKPIIRVQGL
jgi:hypothetical protein